MAHTDIAGSGFQSEVRAAEPARRGGGLGLARMPLHKPAAILSLFWDRSASAKTATALPVLRMRELRAGPRGFVPRSPRVTGDGAAAERVCRLRTQLRSRDKDLGEVEVPGPPRWIRASRLCPFPHLSLRLVHKAQWILAEVLAPSPSQSLPSPMHWASHHPPAEMLVTAPHSPTCTAVSRSF